MKAQTQIREYDFDTIRKLLTITANEIAYPQEAPANTSDKQPPKGFKKYDSFNYRNITDNQGWIPVKIDYHSFKPKKYYKDVEEQKLEKHLQALQKKEDLLKHFKHYEDFDRLDYVNNKKSNTLENHFQKAIVSHAVLSLVVSRALMIHLHHHKFSFTLWRNVFKRVYFYTLPISFLSGFFYQVTSPVNHQYFRTLPWAERMYETMAYDADAFKYNNDIKYNFKFPEKEDNARTRQHLRSIKREYMYQDGLRYYKRIYGIVDPEPFWNANNKSQQNDAL